jgi:PAS domain S-box-containing protein
MGTLAEVFQQVPDPWWLIDLNTSRFLDANQASVEQLGYSMEEIRGIGVIDVNRAIPSPDAWREITGGIPFGKTVRFLSELKCKSGDMVPVEVTFARVRVGEGEALLAFTRDLSQIVALEEQLKEQQQLLRKLSAQVPGMLYKLCRQADGSMTFQFTSDATREVFGLPSSGGQIDDLSAVLEAVHPEDRQGLLDELERSHRLLTTLHREFRIARPEGAEKWLETWAAPERASDGVTLWYGFTAVVTERKRVELELRRNKELWDMAANAANLGIVQFDQDAGKLWLDPSAANIHGLNNSDSGISLDEWLKAIHPEDRPLLASGMNELAGLRDQLTARYRLGADENSQAVLELHARKFLHEQDRMVEVVGACRDVTEQVGAERLRREKEAAERANRAKSEFLSRVSHELRTPINSILGFAQLMLRDRTHLLSDAHRERLQTLQGAGRRLLSLINDMLDLARIEREDFTLECSPVDAAAVANACISLVRPLAADSEVAFPPIECGTSRWVQGNTRALEQVLTNLLSNAIKYNVAGGRVRVSIREQGDRVYIAVRDDGPGMTPQQQARLFRPFDRLGAERSLVEGTGLGLVIARELGIAMKGELQVRSAPGAGTTFTVVLRAAERAASAQPKLEETVREAPAPAPQPNSSGRRRVLYVEDEAINIMLMEEVFNLCPQWELSVARTGREGLQRAIAELPDLLLVDMNLSDTTGLELIAKMRNTECLRDRLCIAVSADALCEQVDAARRAGFDDYWTKPIDVDRILEDLSQLADRMAV